MIRDRAAKLQEIVWTMKTRSAEINTCYWSGPDLYFYQRVSQVRRQSTDVEMFLCNNYHIELLYATLVAWGMNSRGAKMKYFDEFRGSLLACMERFRGFEVATRSHGPRLDRLLPALRDSYEHLAVMRTGARLVSNSKLLHFLFPDRCMPMDGTNTLNYFYGNVNESVHKYLEITECLYEIMSLPEDWSSHLDDRWNSCVPKMVDNSIILLRGKSVA